MDVTEPARPPAIDDGDRAFAAFAAGVRVQTPLRAAITAACRRPEPECLPPLLDAAAPDGPAAEAAAAQAARLVTALRAKTRAGGVEVSSANMRFEPGRRGAHVPRRGAAANP